MRIILALTVRKFDITPTNDVYRILRLTVMTPLFGNNFSTFPRMVVRCK